ncbi:hypothetical protein ROZALSC1DRAFT_21849 [Rozella allomycis CSF55]|uniref:Uncharacterized protein n=1 Tax=Rozella allomycis (strain CSF55) TaxID=988480 RepID=A0A4P9YLY7_ROZAC|nr:hypothetical protein ROZALSC1DRAFT_21849 [Rozella allomycis CSF55]
MNSASPSILTSKKVSEKDLREYLKLCKKEAKNYREQIYQIRSEKEKNEYIRLSSEGTPNRLHHLHEVTPVLFSKSHLRKQASVEKKLERISKKESKVQRKYIKRKARLHVNHLLRKLQR